MIKNIIFDVGGVILDDSDKPLIKLLNKSSKEIDKINRMIYYTDRFKECLLGKVSQKEYAEELINIYPKYREIINKLLGEEYQEIVLPQRIETIELIKKLKKEGKYKLYILSNFTEASYNYLKNKTNILDYFDGWIFSCLEGMKKPSPEVFELLIERYHLNREETIFFDDRKRNVETANRLGIKSVQFKGIEDVIKNI